ncbi:hypothetical protein [Streptomyces sp. NPDC001876]|uniref:hypothetical protein n=1 Tax=Streptomyces sp. NPDC001876 TaxID=3154402 RepID=UPI0033257349
MTDITPPEVIRRRAARSWVRPLLVLAALSVDLRATAAGGGPGVPLGFASWP